MNGPEYSRRRFIWVADADPRGLVAESPRCAAFNHPTTSAC
jgi:hypothetical protein